MSWTKKKRYTYTKGAFTINYDTAIEFGIAVAEIYHRHGEKIINPYDPMHIEFDQFNEAKMNRLMELKLNK